MRRRSWWNRASLQLDGDKYGKGLIVGREQGRDKGWRRGGEWVGVKGFCCWRSVYRRFHWLPHALFRAIVSSWSKKGSRYCHFPPSSLRPWPPQPPFREETRRGMISWTAGSNPQRLSLRYPEVADLPAIVSRRFCLCSKGHDPVIQPDETSEKEARLKELYDFFDGSVLRRVFQYKGHDRFKKIKIINLTFQKHCQDCLVKAS